MAVLKTLIISNNFKCFNFIDEDDIEEDIEYILCNCYICKEDGNDDIQDTDIQESDIQDDDIQESDTNNDYYEEYDENPCFLPCCDRMSVNGEPVNNDYFSNNGECVLKDINFFSNEEIENNFPYKYFAGN